MTTTNGTKPGTDLVPMLAAPVIIIPPRAELAEQQITVLKQQICPNATDVELDFFISVCNHVQLDPFAKQIYGIKRGGKLTIQLGIDGYWAIAERTGQLDGMEGPFWTADGKEWVDIWLSDDPPRGCRVLIYRKGCARPFPGVCAYEEYVQRDNQGYPLQMWQKMGANQLAKCTIAQALRRAFPAETEVVRRQGIDLGNGIDYEQDDVVEQAPYQLAPASAPQLPAPTQEATSSPSTESPRARIERMAADLEGQLDESRSAIAMMERHRLYAASSIRQLSDADLMSYGKMLKKMVDDPRYDPRPSAASAPVAEQAQEEALKCSGCGTMLTAAQHTLSVRKYDVALCPTCQKERRGEPEAPTQVAAPAPGSCEVCGAPAKAGQVLCAKCDPFDDLYDDPYATAAAAHNARSAQQPVGAAA